LASAAVEDYPRGSSTRSPGRIEASCSHAASLDLKGLEWLDSEHPLDWNGPASRIFTRFREEDLDGPIVGHLERVVRRHRNRIAVTDSDTSLSFADLWEGLSGLAEVIAADTRPGDLIAILLPTCSLFPVAILACLAAGRPFVALDTHYPDDWLRQVLEDARPALIIGNEGIHGAVDIGPPAARFIHLTRLPQAARKDWRPAQLGMDQPACVIFTSGSTGRPKGIVNSQRNLLQRVAQSINAAHVNGEDRFLTLASLSTIVGVRDTITALLAGAGVHLLDPQRAGAREILKVIRTEAITILFGFPALLRSVIACGGERVADDNAALRLVRVGGDTTLWSDIDMLRTWLGPEPAIQLIYAATEAPMMQWFVDDSRRTDDARIPIGYPLPGNRLALIDEYGCNTAPGEVGELVVSSPYVALGLWVNGRSTPGGVESGNVPHCRLFRTGDLVRQRPDGLLERIGRKDRQIKIRGARVDLEGVEAFIRQHRFVRDVATLVRPWIQTNGVDGEGTLIAYVTLRDGSPDGTLDDLKALMRSAPPPMRPGRIYLTSKIPRLPSSKLDLRALMALDEVKVQRESNVAVAAGIGPVGGDCIAEAVARVWRDVLQTPVGRPEDDFFDVGGDSLKAIRFILELERALGQELSLTLITEAPQFAGICQAVKEHHMAGYIPLVVLKPGDNSPPVFIIHGLGGNVAGLLPMTRRMTWPGAVIGIQARGLAGKDPPHTTVEAMAAEYLRVVKARQPEGPYNLCGYSFGGLVAFEMAKRLRESGDDVAMVGLFDTLMSPLKWPLRSWLSIVRGRVARFAAGVLAAPIRTWATAAWKMARRAYERQRAPARVLKVEAGALLASARHRPGFYPGELTLFTPLERAPGFPSIESAWRKHADALSIVEVAGDHWTMFSTPNAESAAASLTRCLAVHSQGTSPSVTASLHHS
jgi:non-ribosomal peptide synthetase component F/thioesterase domain-containing protein/acyl carrier protein